MTQQDFSNLTGKVLIATPFAMEGNVFHKSLIYIIKHTSEGSVGLIINHLVNNAPANTLFKQADDNINNSDFNLDIHLGGPVEVERGFFLHTSEYTKNILFNPNDCNLAVSSNSQIIRDIADGSGPQKSMFIIGYSGWNEGQLEFELENNLWLVTEPDHDLIFQKHSEEKWGKALATLGISTNDFIETNLASC